MDSVSLKQAPAQARQEKSFLFYLSNSYPNGPYEQQVDRHLTGITIENPASETIPREDTIRWVDKVAKKTTIRRIRFIAKCDTIFFDEQKAMGYDEKYEPNNSDIITFESGQLLVSERESNLLKFLELTNYSEDNENRDTRVTALFKMDRSSELMAKGLVDDKKVTKAKSIVYEMSDEELEETRKIFPNIRFNVKENKTELVDSLIKIAGLNPDAIIAGLSEEKNKVLSEISSSLESGVIVLGAKGYNFLTEDEKLGEGILEVPNNKKSQAPDLLAKFLMNTEGGKAIRLQLQRMVKAKNEGVKKEIAV